ncbi:filamentous hemagglutinin family N-terminal domain-containing protein [Pollutimonas bauzanensis]|uniref:Filamentous hemagglutinin family N-terminal domain-containing protein n=1 Tax=Pollutimonas bauzanensis TaxID=658167 RepID=A0A1M5ZM56_9BURK|nr:filamentous hemagglutinin family N-terminal domain-containing protein [Pollutimonas bauzanensis]
MNPEFHATDGKIEDEARAWVRRLSSGRATKADARRLEQWCARSPSHQTAFERARQEWQAIGPLAQTYRSLYRESAPVAVKSPGRRWFMGAGLTAMGALTVVAAVRPPLGLWPSWSELGADYRTGTGEQRQVALSEHIDLTLNTQTSLAVESHGAAQAQAAATGRLPNGMLASTNPAARQQQAAREQLNRSVANLGSAAAAIAAQQAVQAAARAGAQNDSSVPDGLAEGGLKIDTSRPFNEAWLNAKAPVQTQADGRCNVAIQQTADKAILNWETFNVGRNTTVNFDQATYDAGGHRTAQTGWAVLNRVNDPAARPSQIQGQIKDDGTVMIANANGVVFSGTSQVNVRNLVAAAANISDPQFKDRGLYNGESATFTEAGGKVTVQAGAVIETASPANSTTGGGYVLLAGKEVHNAGTLTAAKGQVALAAGDSFVIKKGQGTEGNQASTTRGNQVTANSAAGSDAGKVLNSGLIQAATGDITLSGNQVEQNGVALASTSVDVRGTVHLAASGANGSVTLGAGGATAILLEDTAATALDSQRDSLLDPANLAAPGAPLAGQAGKVAKTYEAELVDWLAGRYGFSGDAEQALAFYAALPDEQRRVFARDVYFAELKAGGREYNEAGGVREGSYLRGRAAIAALFPEKDVAGNPITYKGDITMYGAAGVHTDFGGSIQMLTPGGAQIFGVEGEAPPGSAGVITQGMGDIQLYSLGSILLGQSRIMTTFGGDILAWSAQGDINAGRGSKTTVVHGSLYAATAGVRQLGQRRPVADGAQQRRGHRHAEPDSGSAAGRYRPAGAAGNHRCRRGGHPCLGQHQHRGAACGERRQHPGAGRRHRHSGAGFRRYRGAGLGQFGGHVGRGRGAGVAAARPG